MTEAGMRKRWHRQEASPRDQALALALARDLQLPPLLTRLLVQRGLRNADVVTRFLHPKLTDLHDPALLPGCAPAAARLVQAVRAQQPIIIYGDYDVDGVTGSAILWHVLKLAGAQVAIYIPHRIDEGYGLNRDAIERIARLGLRAGDEDNADPADASPLTPPPAQRPLVITVDCGITAVEPARSARALGLELIITDHHQFDSQQLPEADILVHPRLNNDYPFGDLCGAGVAFKLAWQFAKTLHNSERVPSDYKALLLDLVSLAALGTVADVVPLLDENRLLTIYGLGQIKRTRFAGLNALIDVARLRDEKIDSYHVGFVLGPRLNACGRMGHARDAAFLLTEAQGERATEIARFLTRKNEERRATERAIFTQAKALVLEHGYDQAGRRAIVLGQEGWHAGVVGIVASRLVEAFHRPVVLLNIEDGLAHGSARSVEGVSIHEAFTACATHLTSFGGHAMAAGLRLEAARIEVFREALVAFINDRLPPENLTGVLTFDAECAIDDVGLPLWEQLQRLAPFGRGNEAPTLCLRGVTLAQAPLRMGASGAHLRLTLRRDRKLAQAVWFHAGDLAEKLVAGVELDVLFEPVVSTWQGRKRCELHVCDVRISGRSAPTTGDTDSPAATVGKENDPDYY